MTPEFTSDWFSRNIPNWTRWLAPFKDQPVSALEIGSYEGRSAVWLMEHILTHRDSRLTCVDTFECGQDLPAVVDGSLKARFLSNVEPWRKRLQVEAVASADKLARFRSLNREFSFIYIDGSHLAWDVLRDAVLAWDVLKPGGLLIFDDNDWGVDPVPSHQPRTAIAAFRACYAGRFEVVFDGFQVCLKKIN